MPANRNIPNLTIPRVRIRVTAVLPAAPAVETSAWTSCSGFNWLTLYLTYDAAAANGAVTFYLLFRPGELTPGLGFGTGYRMTAYAVGGVAAGVDTASLIQREAVTYEAITLNPEGFVWGPIAIRGTVEEFAVVMTESGVPGTPGSFGIDVQMAV